MKPVTNAIDACLFDALRDADRATAVGALLQAPPSRHIDDEDIAAIIERTPTPRALAHAATCAPCRGRVHTVEPLVRMAAFPDPRARSAPLLRTRPLFATVAIGGTGLQLRRHSGVRRSSAAAAVRSAAGLQGVGLRDDARAPVWEVQLAPEGVAGRLRIHARWLDDDTPARWIRAFQGGRLVGEAPFRDGIASLSELRARDLRLEAGADDPIAVAWIAVEEAA